MNDPVSFFKCLGDETRFNIVCRLYKSDSYIELLASQLHLTPGTVSFHIKKLEEEGLVSCSRTQFYVIYSLNRSVLHTTLEAIIAAHPVVDEKDEYGEKVLSSFFKGGKLLQIPVQEKKRRIVLAEIMKEFKAGQDYPEKEVDAIVKKYYDDHCTLRRWLIEDGLMTRDHEIYRVKENE